MAEKCLTSNVAVFTGYWIVFSRSAELIYEIRNWREGLHSFAGVQFQVSAGLKVWMEVQVKVGCACVV